MFDAIMNFLQQTGFAMFTGENLLNLAMIAIAFVLSYLAIVKKFEPLLLLPIAFGMLLTNLPGAEMFHEQLFAGGHVNWDMFGGAYYISSNALNGDLLEAFGVLENGSVYASQYVIGHLSGLALDAEAAFNAAGQVIAANGEVLADSARIVLDSSLLTIKDGAAYLGETMKQTACSPSPPACWIISISA